MKKTITYDTDTHVLVPREATEAQLDAFDNFVMSAGLNTSWYSLARAYNKIVEAAPKEPK